MANTVQENLSDSILDQFHVALGTNITSKTTDWSSRQQIEYAAIKGLIANDFHGLKDFYDQMSLYSSTNIILRVAWSVIQGIVPTNPDVRSTLVEIPNMGLVGNFLLTLTGFSNIFVAPQDLLSNSDKLDSTISSLL